MEKDTISLLVSNMSSSILLVFVVSDTPETPNIGTFCGVVQLVEFFNLKKKLFFKCVYAHI